MSQERELFLPPLEIISDGLRITTIKSSKEFKEICDITEDYYEDAKELIKDKIGYYKATASTIFAIYKIEDLDNTPLGKIDLTYLNLENMVAEYSRSFSEEKQGKGYGYISLKLIAEKIILPASGKFVEYVRNIPNEYDLNTSEAELTTAISSKPFYGAYALSETIVTNYPSLFSNIKAGAKILSIIGNSAICAFGKNLESNISEEKIRSISKEMMMNHENEPIISDISQNIKDLIEDTSEPASVISLIMRFLAETGKINWGGMPIFISFQNWDKLKSANIPEDLRAKFYDALKEFSKEGDDLNPILQTSKDLFQLPSQELIENFYDEQQIAIIGEEIANIDFA